MASSKSLRGYGFSEHKSVFRSIRKGAFLVCACAKVSCSKIRKSICLLRQGKKQLYMPSEISNETSWIESSIALHLQGSGCNQDRQYFSRLSQLFYKKREGEQRVALVWSLNEITSWTFKIIQKIKGHFKQSGVSIYSAEYLFLNCHKTKTLKLTESCALLKGAVTLEEGVTGEEKCRGKSFM